jgi:Zn-dependent protease
MLRWSINLFRVFGIQLAVHVSFFLLLAYYGYEGWQDGRTSGLLWSLALIVLFFVCVVLHELGHSLTARRFGVRVPRILLLPIGGMAEFDRIPKKPSEELLITVAGPAVNFALVILLLPLCWRTLLSGTEVVEFSSANLIAQLWLGNLLMGTFNLLPVFPMDGGRIFRALLAIKLPYLRATYWAATVGRVLALIFAAVAAFYLNRQITCVLFLFIFWAGDAEYKHTLRRDEEERYWAEMSRRLNVVEATSGDSPSPPLLNPGSN